MVLKDWKLDINDTRPEWGRGLTGPDYWSLLNYVMDEVTFPSCAIKMGCHEDEPLVPLCWGASRDGRLMHLRARESLRAQPDLAAELQRLLMGGMSLSSADIEPWNPFAEMKRARKCQ